MRGWRGVAGTVAGTAAAGVAAGVAAERYALNRLRGRLDPDVVRRFHQPRGRHLTVTADDGVPLHVEVDETGPDDFTIVFCHGYTLHHACWYYQRQELSDLGRLVFWDQRSHGRSGRGEPGSATIDGLGDDLRAVLDAVAPRGSLVLAGHSMGAMTIMALAARYPELVRERVKGAALMSTSAGKLDEFIPGLLSTAASRITPSLLSILGRVSGAVQRVRAMGNLVSYVSTQRLAFGTLDVSPEVVAFLDAMISATPVDVVAEFYPAIVNHDNQAALEVLRHTPTLVLAGAEDRLLPAAAGAAIADALPEARHVPVAGAGHMVILERPDLVNRELRDLVRRAVRHEPTERSA